MVKAFVQTPMTRRVKKIRWNQNEKIIVFKSNTAQLDEN